LTEDGSLAAQSAQLDQGQGALDQLRRARVVAQSVLAVLCQLDVGEAACRAGRDQALPDRDGPSGALEPAVERRDTHQEPLTLASGKPEGERPLVAEGRGVELAEVREG